MILENIEKLQKYVANIRKKQWKSNDFTDDVRLNLGECKNI